MRSDRNQRRPHRFRPENGAPLSFCQLLRRAKPILILVLGSISLPLLGQAPPFANANQQGNVTIVDYAFRPFRLNATTGTTVVWTYATNGSDIHTVTSDNKTQDGSPVFSSTSTNLGILHPGQTYNYTFNLPGSYLYHCGVHPYMKGWISVTGTAITPPSSHPPTNAGTLLVVVGVGVGATVAAGAVSLTYRQRIRKKSATPPST